MNAESGRIFADKMRKQLFFVVERFFFVVGVVERNVVVFVGLFFFFFFFVFVVFGFFFVAESVVCEFFVLHFFEREFPVVFVGRVEIFFGFFGFFFVDIVVKGRFFVLCACAGGTDLFTFVKVIFVANGAEVGFFAFFFVFVEIRRQARAFKFLLAYFAIVFVF